MNAHTTAPEPCSVAEVQAALLGVSTTPRAEAYARMMHQVVPRAWGLAHAGRDWVGALLTQLRPWGLTQVADLGCGMPRRTPATASHPVDTHEYALAVRMRRCAYLDIDPAVVEHRRAGLAPYQGGAALADLTDLAQVRAGLAACDIDPHQPTVLILGWVLALLDDDQALSVLASLPNLVAPDSYVAVSHPTGRGPWSALMTRTTGALVQFRSAPHLLDLMTQSGMVPHQGPTPVTAWPTPACPTPGTDVLCALARIGGQR
ncbi:SAM-dependent methyltransferase [Nocardiopsis alborubida]|uniref:S-adenosyl methyltransferase n=1 Tax=Nocardiopsis alborubida TaxID=146802 RepID=A0A7X6M8M2_9ACTN|nr:SAM-dependent methyltransferase [Nocardiopsis alborubida]NKY96751.1 hypothetical protein [Nocardiopsis alborubida]